MSHTRQALVTLRASTELLARSIKLPTVSASARMVEVLAAGDAAPAGPGPDILEAVRRNLLQAARAPGGIASASPQDLRDAPWLMWDRREPLATIRGFWMPFSNVANAVRGHAGH